ncbi:MAG: radical SAM protein [Candidatus Margulisbacteria bacterium]|nr:radical SAM protein [Candidatus Margulisiibacteriota bacterium]
MHNENFILKLNKNTIKRFEYNSDGGLLFLFNAITRRNWTGNDSSYEILKLIDGKRTLAEIYTELGKIFNNLSSGEVIESTNSILTKWIHEKFINVIEPQNNVNSEEYNWLNKNVADCIKTYLDFHFNKPRNSRTPQEEFRLFHINIAESKHKKTERYYFQHPISVRLIVDSDCNLRCKHCYYYDKPEIYNNENNTSKEKIFEAIDIIAEKFSSHFMLITGGEPFLRTDILEILEYIKSKNIVVYIQTNGTLLTDEIIERLEKILNLNTDVIQVSIDGLKSSSHEKTRGKKAFNKSIKALRELVKRGFITAVNCTALSANVHELPQIYEFLRDLKVEKITFGKFDLKSDKQRYLIPDKDILFKAAAEIIRIYMEDDFQNLNINLFENIELINDKKVVKYIDQYLPESNESSTYDDLSCACDSGFCINSDGSVQLCPEVYALGKEFIMGNINTESLVDIWEKRHDNLFFQPKMKDQMLCNKCKYVSLCKGGCPAKAYAEYGDKHMPDPGCRIGAEMVKKYKKSEE